MILLPYAGRRAPYLYSRGLHFVLYLLEVRQGLWAALVNKLPLRNGREGAALVVVPQPSGEVVVGHGRLLGVPHGPHGRDDVGLDQPEGGLLLVLPANHGRVVLAGGEEPDQELPVLGAAG